MRSLPDLALFWHVKWSSEECSLSKNLPQNGRISMLTYHEGTHRRPKLRSNPQTSDELLVGAMLFSTNSFGVGNNALSDAELSYTRTNITRTIERMSTLRTNKLGHAGRYSVQCNTSTTGLLCSPAADSVIISTQSRVTCLFQDACHTSIQDITVNRQHQISTTLSQSKAACQM